MTQHRTAHEHHVTREHHAPHDHHTPHEQQSRPPRKPPRWVQWTVVPLLILVPIGYVIISAEQSRDSGEDKEAVAALTSLTEDWPTRVQRRIYQVPIPDGAENVAYLETNSWDSSALFVQFTTTPGGLDTFLAQVGTSRAGSGSVWACSCCPPPTTTRPCRPPLAPHPPRAPPPPRPMHRRHHTAPAGRARRTPSTPARGIRHHPARATDGPGERRGRVGRPRTPRQPR